MTPAPEESDPRTVTAERWARLKDLFSAVVERGPDIDHSWIAGLCQEDESLTADLLALVREHFRLEAGRAGSRDEELPFGMESEANARFRFLVRIGRGSFGDVFKVHDERRGCVVALKVLRESNPSAQLRFKREFRNLADFEHPNLVRLYELIWDDPRWMFTMEYVDGCDFLTHAGISGGAVTLAVPEREARIRAALPQLVSGLTSLHQSGLLHRDLKPANVMVSWTGRVCLLDFGLVRAFGTDTLQKFTIGGTPAYMSPEQARGDSLTEASDWYAIGVMIYEALTGQLPFAGVDVLQRKQVDPPVAPAVLEPGITDDLNRLCVRLLDPDPAIRMEMVSAVRHSAPQYPPFRVASSGSTPRPILLGRDSELAHLEKAYSRWRTSTVLRGWARPCWSVNSCRNANRMTPRFWYFRGAAMRASRCRSRVWTIWWIALHSDCGICRPAN